MAYDKTTWNTGDVVTAEKLNKLENGVAENSSSSSGGVFVVNVTSHYDEEAETEVYTHDADINDIMDAWYNGKLIKTVTVGTDIFDPTITYTYTEVYGFCYLKDFGDDGQNNYVGAITYRPQYVSQAGGWVTGLSGARFSANGDFTEIQFV